MVYPKFDERDLRSLRVFCAVAHARGFTAAEQRIHLSKASISRHIRELEDKLGMRLCQRGPGGFELTPAGIAALESGSRALEALDRVMPEIDSVHGVLSGPLYVGVTEHVLISGGSGIPAALEILRSRAPGVRVELTVLSYWQLKRALREGRVEIAIHGRYGNDRSLEYLALFEEEHRLYARPDFSPLPGASVRLVTRTHPFVEVLLDTPPYVPGPVANGLESVAFYIAAGDCVGLLPEHYASLVSARFPLRVWDDAARFKATICAVTVRARGCSKAATLLLDILKAQVG